MAGADRMPIEEVVRKVLLDEHADVLREAVGRRGGVDGDRGARADRRRALRAPARRATHRNGYRPRRWDTRAGTSSCRSPSSARAATSRASWSPESAPSKRCSAVVQQAYVSGVSTRRVDQLVESSGCASRRARSAASARRSMSRSRRSGAAAGGPLPVSVAGRPDRAGPRRRPGGPQGAGGRPRRARDRPARDHRHRRRRGRDRGVLARVPARSRRPRSGRRAAGHLRRPRRAEGGDRPGARRAVAALHRPLPQGLLGHARKDQHGLLAR